MIYINFFVFFILWFIICFVKDVFYILEGWLVVINNIVILIIEGLVIFGIINYYFLYYFNIFKLNNKLKFIFFSGILVF